MPISKANRTRYPADWKAVRQAMLQRAGFRCEFVERETGLRCLAVDGGYHPFTLSKVVLTVAHLDHTPENCDPANLLVGCQRCHLRYDAPMKARNRRARNRAAMHTADLFA